MDYENGNKTETSTFEAFELNGGTVMAIAGADFAIIASDSLLSSGPNVHSRTQSKLFELTPLTVLGAVGSWCDVLELSKITVIEAQKYELNHLKQISTNAMAQFISVTMYTRRLFPYCVSLILAGIDKDGKGVVFSYDTFGCYHSVPYRVGGSKGGILNSTVQYLGSILTEDAISELTKEKAVKVIEDVFPTIAKRDKSTGDTLIINIITKDGIEAKTMPLP